MSKFENVPVEDDTAIHMSVETTLWDHDVLYQGWSWDGIEAESVIFVADEVESMDDDALKAYVAKSDIVRDKDRARITLKRNAKGYTFVNFNFVSP